MDRYSKGLLTVIAAALVWNSFKDIPLISNAVASSGVIEVRVVDMKLSGFKSRFEPSPALKYRLSEVLITKTRASTFWVPSQHQPIANTSTPIKCGLISEELNRFAAVKQDRNKWTKRTMDDYQSVFETFVEIIGDKPVNQINQQDIECYLSMLNYLPPNRKKDPTYSNLSAQKACSLNKEKRGVTLSDKSKNKYIERLVGPFQKFVDSKYIPYNFFTHVERYKITRADRLAAREPFTDDELKIIFESDQSIELLNAKACMPSRVWGLLIALFSGARAEEIFALTLQDVKIDDETMYFDIVDRDDHSHVKTAAGIRAVPVHRKLLELGFKDYLNKARKVQPKLDCPMLFPDLTRSPSHGWSRNTTRWYNEQFLRQLGIKQDTRKVFHSFRHTLADKFKRNWKANQLMVSSYLGHDDDYSGRPEWKKGYGSKFSPTELREIADLIEFDINFDMLKKNCLDKLKVRRVLTD